MATFTNTASLTYDGKTTLSNTIVGEILQQLSVTKNALRPIYSNNENITYVVSIVNSGNTEITNLTVTDNLGKYSFSALSLTPLTYVMGSIKYYVNGVLQPTVAAEVTEDALVAGPVSVPAGGNVQLIYEANVNQYADPTATGAIQNTVTITGGGIADDITDTETVNADVSPKLSVIKSLSPTTVSQNGTLSYTLTVENSGPTSISAADNVVIADTFDPVLKDITVTYNGTALVQGTNYTYDETTGAFQTLQGQITVPGGTYLQDEETGAWTTTSGKAVIVITGRV